MISTRAPPETSAKDYPGMSFGVPAQIHVWISLRDSYGISLKISPELVSEFSRETSSGVSLNIFPEILLGPLGFSI